MESQSSDLSVGVYSKTRRLLVQIHSQVIAKIRVIRAGRRRKKCLQVLIYPSDILKLKSSLLKCFTTQPSGFIISLKS